MSIVVVYRSKYGATKRYAELIAEQLNSELFDLNQFDARTLADYSVVLFGSSVHIGKLKGADFIKKNWAVLKNKRTALFASIGSPKIEPKHKLVLDASLPADIARAVEYFPLPGAYNYNKLDFTDKLLMNLGPRTNLRFKAWFKVDKRAKQQLAEFCRVQDWTNSEAIKPIIDYIKLLPVKAESIQKEGKKV